MGTRKATVELLKDLAAIGSGEESGCRNVCHTPEL